MTHDGVEVQSWMHNGVEVYSAGKMVTYMVDSGVSYQEKVKKGQSCLAPTTFTPSKSGWAFVGWREDKAASGSVLGSKLMERSPITLYAVFRQVITLSYNGNGATGGSTAAQTGNRYYNNGNIANPSFTLRSNGYSRTYYNFSQWALGSASGTKYNAGSSITLSENTTMYAVWSVATVSKTITKNATARVTNWNHVRTIVFYGVTFTSKPTIKLSGNIYDEAGNYKVYVAETHKSFCIICGDHMSGGEVNVTLTISGTAYQSASAAGIVTKNGTFQADIKNWNGGTQNVNYGARYKALPTVTYYDADNVSYGYNVSIKNKSTTGCAISWSCETGGASHVLGWVSEGNV